MNQATELLESILMRYDIGLSTNQASHLLDTIVTEIETFLDEPAESNMKKVHSVELVSEVDGIRSFEYELFENLEDAMNFFNEQLVENGFTSKDKDPKNSWLYCYGFNGESKSVELKLTEKRLK